MDVPEIEPVVWMTEKSLGRGVIGIGEPPIIPVAGAIGNAVRNAIGVRVGSLPITPRRVLEALEREGAQGWGTLSMSGPPAWQRQCRR